MASLSGDDWGSILSDVLAELVDSITAGRGQAQVLCPAGNQLFIVGSTLPEEVGEAVLIDDSVAGLAWKLGRPVIISDVRIEPRYKSFVDHNSSSEIAAPLANGLGVLNLESPSLNAFEGRDVEVLKRYAERVATTLPKAVISFGSNFSLRDSKEK